MSTYRPLPNSLTIKESSVDGLGLFAVVDIEPSIVLGVSHVTDKRFENGFIRTPLGGFVNHSEEPNCQFIKRDDVMELVPLRKILSGEEIVVKYWMYEVKS